MITIFFCGITATFILFMLAMILKSVIRHLKHSNNTLNRYIKRIFLFLMLWSCYVVYVSFSLHYPDTELYKLIYPVNFTLAFCIIPQLWFYLHSQLNPASLLPKRVLIMHYIPAMLSGFFLVYMLFFMPEPKRISSLLEQTFDSQIEIRIVRTLLWLQTICYLTYSITRIYLAGKTRLYYLNKEIYFTAGELIRYLVLVLILITANLIFCIFNQSFSSNVLFRMVELWMVIGYLMMKFFNFNHKPDSMRIFGACNPATPPVYTPYSNTLLPYGTLQQQPSTNSYNTVYNQAITLEPGVVLMLPDTSRSARYGFVNHQAEDTACENQSAYTDCSEYRSGHFTVLPAPLFTNIDPIAAFSAFMTHSTTHMYPLALLPANTQEYPPQHDPETVVPDTTQCLNSPDQDHCTNDTTALPHPQHNYANSEHDQHLQEKNRERFLIICCNMYKGNFYSKKNAKAEFATLLGVSESTISNILSPYGFKSWKAFHDDCRFYHACIRLTKNPDITVSTLALDIGYASIDPLTNLFRSKTGFTVNEYCDQLKSKPGMHIVIPPTPEIPDNWEKYLIKDGPAPTKYPIK